jgi:hypothetical protein
MLNDGAVDGNITICVPCAVNAAARLIATFANNTNMVNAQMPTIWVKPLGLDHRVAIPTTLPPVFVSHDGNAKTTAFKVGFRWTGKHSGHAVQRDLPTRAQLANLSVAIKRTVQPRQSDIKLFSQKRYFLKISNYILLLKNHNICYWCK